MRKIIALLLVFVLLVGMTACGTEKGNVSSEPTSSIAESSEPASAPLEDEPITTTDAEADETTTTEDEVDKTTTTETEADKTTTTEDEVDKTTTTETKADKTTTTSNRKTKTSRTIKVTTTKNQTTTTTTKGEPTTTTTVTPVNKVLDVNGSSNDLTTWIYQLEVGGVMVREAVFDSGKGGDPAEIVQITDIHFNKLNDRDFKENNPSVMANYKDRTMNPNGSSAGKMLKCLEYAADYDQTIITGDTIDYLTWGAIEMVHDVIWKTDPNALVALGNHDSVRIWRGVKGYVKDETTLESRYQILEENWKHDIYYTSKVIKNKAMVIQMDNGNQHFWDDQIKKLENDIKTARANGYVVLLFYHIPIPTGGEKNTIYSIDGKSNMRFDFTDMLRDHSVNEAMYTLIRNNADVIKGTFCGHEHADYYTEIKAKTPDGKDTVIPQYVLAASHLNYGHVFKITVK